MLYLIFDFIELFFRSVLLHNTRAENVVSTPAPNSARDSKRLPQELADLVLLLKVDAKMEIPSLISVLNPPEVPELAEALLEVYLLDDAELLERLLLWASKKHLAECSDAAGLFRTTNLEIKIISVYIHRECKTFVESVIGPFLEKLSSVGVLEVDSAKVNASEIDGNQKKLLQLANELLVAVSAHVSLIPSGVCKFMKQIQEVVGKKFPDMVVKRFFSFFDFFVS